MHWIAGSVIVVIVSSLISFIGVLVDAWHEANNAPKTPMFSCDKHGLIPSKYMLHIPFDGITDKPINVCPMCYEDRCKTALSNMRGKR
jgi:hypothetical protein